MIGLANAEPKRTPLGVPGACSPVNATVSVLADAPWGGTTKAMIATVNPMRTEYLVPYRAAANIGNLLRKESSIGVHITLIRLALEGLRLPR